MSDHLLRDLADPNYHRWQEAKKQWKWMEYVKGEIYLPMRLLPHFDEIQYDKSGCINLVYCPACGEDVTTAGHLWVWNGEPWHPSQGILWIFCSECFYVFSKNQSINYNE